jgi:hypothetical protein
MDCAFFDDGYTRNGYLADKPGVHPEVRFRYRPTLVAEQAVVLNWFTSDPPAVRVGKCAEMLSKHLLEWSIAGADGLKLPITPKNLMRINPRIFSRLVDIVSCSAASDVDPDATPEESEETARAKALLIESGSDGLETAEVKN